MATPLPTCSVVLLWALAVCGAAADLHAAEGQRFYVIGSPGAWFAHQIAMRQGGMRSTGTAAPHQQQLASHWVGSGGAVAAEVGQGNVMLAGDSSPDSMRCCEECDLQCCDPCCGSQIELFTTVDAFEGPMDLDGHNGNFGFRFGVNGGFPLLAGRGIGVQAGTSEVLADLYGTQFTGSSVRAQNFTTVGVFQRNMAAAPRLSWGFAYDWLYDEYYTTFTMSQWRVKLAWEVNVCNEIGLWACIPDSGDSALLGSPGQGYSLDRFRPVAQGNCYWRHQWGGGKNTSCWIGIADEPGEIVFGGDAWIPLSHRLAVIGGFNYMLPSASGEAGQDEEIWNLSVGVAFTPGRSGGRVGKFAPLLPLADNGIFAVRRY